MRPWPTISTALQCGGKSTALLSSMRSGDAFMRPRSGVMNDRIPVPRRRRAEMRKPRGVRVGWTIDSGLDRSRAEGGNDAAVMALE